mgnify:CR=1 FL=1
MLALACSKSEPPAKAQPDPSGSPPVEPAADHAPEVETPTDAPEPAPAPEPPPLAVAESAVVVAANGLQLVDVATSQLTAAFEGTVSLCLSQPEAGAIWFVGRAKDAATDAVWAVDLQRGPEAIALASEAPEGISALAVHTWRGGTIATHTPDDFEVGLLLDLRSVPMTRRTLGCQSERTDCWEDPAAEKLHPPLEALATAIEGVRLSDPGVAKRLGDRALAVSKPRLPKPLDNLTVPSEPCRDEPVDCGRRVEIPGLPYHLVVTGNDRGDLFHESLQLYDPAAATWAPLSDPKATAAEPLAEGSEIGRLFVAGSGQAYAIDDRVVHLTRGTLVSDVEVCGFTTPGAILTGVTK